MPDRRAHRARAAGAAQGRHDRAGRSRRRRSTRGSSTRSCSSTRSPQTVASAEALDTDLLLLAKDHGFSDAQIAQLRGFGSEAEAREVRAHPRHPPGLQDRRHVRGGVPGAHAVPLLELRPRDRGGADRPHARSSSSARGRTASARASSSTTPACTRRSRCSDAGLRDDHDQLQPRDGLDRLRHERPALLRAAHARGRARGHPRRVAVRRARRASSCSSAARPRSGSRRASRRPACRSSARAPTRSTSPRSAACSRASSTPPGLLAPRNGTAIDVAGAVHVAEGIGYPVLVRPSYVLGGRGMEIVYDTPVARRLLRRASRARPSSGPSQPLLVDRFLDDAHRDRRRRALRRHRTVRRRRHGAHRGGRHPLRRLELHAAARDARPRRGRPGARGDPRRSPRASACAACSTCSSRSGRACSTCSRRTRGRAAPCRSCRRRSASRSPRPPRRIMVGATIAELIERGHAAGVRRLARAARRAGRGEGGGAAVQAVPHPRGHHRRLGARPRDALDRRGHGHRPRLPAGVREEPGRRVRRACRRPAPSSCRSPTATSARSCCRCCACRSSASTSSRPRARPRCSRATASRRARCASSGTGADRRRDPSVVELINRGEIDVVVNTPSGRTARADGYRDPHRDGRRRQAAVHDDRPALGGRRLVRGRAGTGSR